MHSIPVFQELHLDQLVQLVINQLLQLQEGLPHQLLVNWVIILNYNIHQLHYILLPVFLAQQQMYINVQMFKHYL